MGTEKAERISDGEFLNNWERKKADEKIVTLQ